VNHVSQKVWTDAEIKEAYDERPSNRQRLIDGYVKRKLVYEAAARDLRQVSCLLTGNELRIARCLAAQKNLDACKSDES